MYILGMLLIRDGGGGGGGGSGAERRRGEEEEEEEEVEVWYFCLDRRLHDLASTHMRHSALAFCLIGIIIKVKPIQSHQDI